MAAKTMFEGLRERAARLREIAAELKRRAESRTEELPELALAAQEEIAGADRRFDEALAEVHTLAQRVQLEEFAARALDRRAEEARRAESDADLAQRIAEMNDARRGYDFAAGEMDRALRDLEDAFMVLRDARNDYVAAMRLAGHADAARALTRRASFILQATAWANAPGLSKALGLERRHFHRAGDAADAVGFLPAKHEEEQR